MTRLADLAARMRADSERWFPDVSGNREPMPLTIAYTLGLAGEAGEVANVVKKINRDGASDRLTADLRDELADVFIYLLLLAEHVGCDLEAAYERKREHNRRRWDDGRKLAEDLVPGDYVLGCGVVLSAEVGTHRTYVLFDREGCPGSIPPDAPGWTTACNKWSSGYGNTDRVTVRQGGPA